MARGTIQYAASGKFASTGVDDNGDATTLTIDANENLGIGGVSPIGTHSTLTSVRVGGNAIINHTTASAASGSLDITQNANYDTDGSWEYIVTDEVSRYQQSGGEHIFSAAASGTAGNDITWVEALRIKADGKVGIGTTAPSSLLTIRGSADNANLQTLTLTNSDWAANETSQSVSIEFLLNRGGTTDSAAGRIVAGKDSDYDDTANVDSFLSFYTAINDGNTEKMRILSDGKVGIGTTAPVAALSIEGNNNTTSEITLKNTSPSPDAFWAITALYDQDTLAFRSVNNSYGNRLTLTADGALTLTGTTDSILTMTVGSTSNDARIDFNNGSSVDGGITYDHNSSASSEKLILRAGNNGNHFFLNGDGHVGIGNSTPNVRLDTICNTNEVVASFSRSNDASSFVTIRTAETQNHTANWYHTVGASAATAVGSSNSVTGTISKVMNSSGALEGQLEFHTNAGDSLTQRMTITKDGNVGIGTTSPAHPLDIAAAANLGLQVKNTNGAYARLMPDSTGANADIRFDFEGGSGSETGVALIFRNGTTQQMRLTGTGDVYMYSLSTTSSYGANMYVHSDGELYRVTSSRRFKTNIVDTTKGLFELLKLRPVDYNSNLPSDDSNKLCTGLIAEEVAEAGFEEYVTRDSENVIESVSYPSMVTLCIKAIQELSAKVKALESAG